MLLFANATLKQKDDIFMFLAEWLCNVSVVVGMDAALEEDDFGETQVTEGVIISQWSGLSVSDAEKDELRDKVDEILRPLGMHTKLLVMARDNSIALYFICMMLSALMSLRDLWTSGQLRDIVQKLFALLSRGARTVHVKRLTWPLTGYERCVKVFNPLQGNQQSLQ